MTHEHEPWMLSDSPEGGRYCMACGQPVNRFESTLAEAAWTITRRGWADVADNRDGGGGWSALVALNSTTLLNVGENDLSARFRAEHGDADTLLVWLTLHDGNRFRVARYADDIHDRDARAVEVAYYASVNPNEPGDPE